MTQPERFAWFHAFSGIAGDMALGALIDAGAEVEAVRQMLESLPFDGWTLETESTTRGGIAATNITVKVSDESTHRTARTIIDMIADSDLPGRVRARSVDTFTALATVEAALHGSTVDQVHFHEVGGHDAIVDIVGVACALELLEIDRVVSSPVAVGLGMVRSAHGAIPNPAPATVRLLEGIATHGIDIDLELTTPTGAALLRALAEGCGPMPAMAVQSSGFGAGDAVLADRPNLLQVVVGQSTEVGSSVSGQPVVRVEANVDDVTGEVLADTVAALLAAGAHDAWLTPIVGKKGRPATIVSALADVAVVAAMKETIIHHTGTFGVRASELSRWPVERQFDEVQVDGHSVRIKVGSHRAKVEHDDAVRVAAATGQSVRDITSRAEEAYRADRFGS